MPGTYFCGCAWCEVRTSAVGARHVWWFSAAEDAEVRRREFGAGMSRLVWCLVRCQARTSLLLARTSVVGARHVTRFARQVLAVGCCGRRRSTENEVCFGARHGGLRAQQGVRCQARRGGHGGGGTEGGHGGGYSRHGLLWLVPGTEVAIGLALGRGLFPNRAPHGAIGRRFKGDG